MLIVVGIIGVLIAIFLPAIGAARRNARYAQCAAKLQFIGKACQLHVSKHDGYLPLAGRISAPAGTNPSNYSEGVDDPVRTRFVWANTPSSSTINATVVPFTAALAVDMGMPNLPKQDWQLVDRQLNNKDGVWRHFMCPDAEAQDNKLPILGDSNGNWQDQGTMIICDIGGSVAMGWASNGDYGANEGALGYHHDLKFRRNRLGGKISMIRRSSEVALFGDAVPRRVASDARLPNNGWITWTPKIDATGAVTLGDAFAGNAKAESPQNFDTRRHGKRMNVLFADGHVEGMPVEKAALDRVYLVEP